MWRNVNASCFVVACMAVIWRVKSVCASVRRSPCRLSSRLRPLSSSQRRGLPRRYTVADHVTDVLNPRKTAADIVETSQWRRFALARHRRPSSHSCCCSSAQVALLRPSRHSGSVSRGDAAPAAASPFINKVWIFRSGLFSYVPSAVLSDFGCAFLAPPKTPFQDGVRARRFVFCLHGVCAKCRLFTFSVQSK